MLTINLDSLDMTKKVAKLCEDYRSSYGFNTDIIKGHYIIDGCSQLALVSLLGNFVTVDPLTDDKWVKDKFIRDIVAIGGCFSKEEE
jgi:hypothetical protein